MLRCRRAGAPAPDVRVGEKLPRTRGGGTQGRRGTPLVGCGWVSVSHFAPVRRGTGKAT